MPQYPCDLHDQSIKRIENDINAMGKKYDTVLFGEKGYNGIVGNQSRTYGEIKLVKLYLAGVSFMCVGIIGLLVRLVFFGPIK